jgi:hypothetical protein
MRTLLAAMLLLGACAAGQAAPLFEQPTDARAIGAALDGISRELRGAQTLRGRYSQRKTLRELPRPLLAEGSFLFVRDRGVVWRTETPFVSELVITSDALVQRQNGSSQRLSAEQQPAIRLVGQIFFAVFSLDFATLEQMFRLHGGAQGGGQWALGLRPLQVAGSLREIEVRGDTQVRRVILREDAGDLTEIELREVVYSTAPPTAADLAPFRP